MATNAGRVQVSIVPDTSGFAAQADAELTPIVNRMGRDLGQSLTRSINSALDFSGLNRRLQESLDQAELQATRAGRNAGRKFADAFRDEIEPRLRRMMDTLPAARIRLDLDPETLAAFRARMANLTQNQTVTIHIRTDDPNLRNFRNDVNGLTRSLGGGSGGAAAAGGGIGLMGALKGAAITLGTLLVPAIGAAVPALLGGAAAVGTLKIAFSGVGKALEAQAKGQKEYEKALKKLSPEQRTFTQALVGLKKEFSPIGKEIQKAALPGFTKLVKDAAPVVKILGRSMHNLASDFGDLAAKAGKAIQNSGFQKLLDTNLRLGAGFIHGVASSVGGLTQSLLEFGAKSKPTLDGIQNFLGHLMSQGLPGFFKGLEPGIRGAAQILDGLDYSLNAKIIPALGRGLGALTEAFGPLVQQTLKLFGDVAGTALDLLSSGMRKATPFLHDLAAGLHGLRMVFADMAPTFKDLGATIIEAFLPVGGGGKGPLASLADSINNNKIAIQEAARVFANVVIDMVRVGVNSLPILVHAFHIMASGVIAALGAVLTAADNAWGWLPGIGGKIHAAREAFDGFAANFNSKLGAADAAASAFAASVGPKLDSGQLKLNITNWTQQIATAKQQLADKNLPPEKRVQLRAIIADLEAKIHNAKGQLAAMPDSRQSKVRANLSDLQSKLKTAENRLDHVPDSRKAQIRAEISQLERQIRAARGELASLHDKTVTVTINGRATGINPAQYYSQGPHKANGGLIPRYASGGNIQMFPNGGFIQGPGTGTSDSILAFMGSGAMAHVSNTEYVIRAAAVKKYGVAFLDAVNQGVFNAKKLASGGLVPKLATGGTAKKPNPLPKNTVLFNGQRVNESSIISAIGISFINGLEGSASQIQSATNRVVQAIQNAFRGVKSTVDDRVIKMLESQAKKLKELAKARDALTAKIAQAQQFATDTTSGAKSFASLASLPNSGAGFGASGVLSSLQTRLSQLRTFSGNISKLFKMGLSKGLIQQIIQMGPDQGAAYAAALVQATPSQLKSINSTQAAIDKTSTAFGRNSADLMYDAGRQAGKGFLTGLKAQQKSIVDSMSSLAKAIQKAIKHALEIHSPSRVMHRLGEFTGLGFKGGLDSTRQAIVSSAQQMAGAVQRGVGIEPAVRQERSQPHVTFHATTTDKPTRQTVMDALRDYNALYGAQIAM
ncbi:hypothetical protein ABZ904_17970 [Streptomyces sp. NPDC046900]|uniref:hypothetical protein n=1 Tax=Streptomyces sp. NPDC046900 TaxID=3155473 RepID=UPI00340B755E